MTLFDPGWRGEQTKGPEDWGVADLGNDPMGIIDRCVFGWLFRSDIWQVICMPWLLDQWLLWLVRLCMLPCTACNNLRGLSGSAQLCCTAVCLEKCVTHSMLAVTSPNCVWYLAPMTAGAPATTLPGPL